MEFKFGLNLTLLLAFVTKVLGHSEFSCYVCDNCAKIDKNTPLLPCGGVEPQMQHSTMMPPTTTSRSTPQPTSTTEPTTTHSPPETPAPSTIGPLPSTTSQPASTTVEHMEHEHMHNATNQTVLANSTLNLSTEPTLFVTPTISEELFISTIEPALNGTNNNFNRQRRHSPDGLHYQCYSMEVKRNNVTTIKRGCIGTEPKKSACEELVAASSDQIQKCQPCKKNKCNGSSTIGISLATLLVTLIAIIFKA